ncbi:MAG TPA: putative baseplate assembly protein [Pyrinomonadaceae bacterium]|nr:putative baseplate assembly protein [Pyrinomonadaceae bacterium]
MKYFCCEERRRNAVAAHPALNGIEFLEVSDDPADAPEQRQRTLYVHFIKDLDPVALTIQNVRIEGGERIRQIKATNVTAAPGGEARVLSVDVDRAGDFSTYTLRLIKSGDDADAPDGFDPILSAVDFSFKVACPSDFDCEEVRACPPEHLPQPLINYLAKDYASFRQLMLDRMSVLMPQWTTRNPADMGIALVEMLAYVGDHLSYQQDAVGTEAYLGTARRRTSVRRHARLVDYHMHDGANARAWVQVRVEGNNVQLAGGTQIFSRLPHLPQRIQPASSEYDEALAGRPVVFETMRPALLRVAHNRMLFHTWGDERCCLPKGATRATLRNEGGSLDALAVGDVLILIEARNPQNGNAAEADPAHRHAVRLNGIKPATDPLYTDEDGVQPLRVLDIEWAADDALPFPLCLWEVETGDEANEKEPASVALGNIVLADHGRSIAGEFLGSVPASNPALNRAAPHDPDFCQERKTELSPPRFRPQLGHRPLAYVSPLDPAQPIVSAGAVMNWPVSEFVPAVRLTGTLNAQTAEWLPQRDLLASEAGAPEFVVEVETDGTAYVRFGDDRFGSRPPVGTAFTADYRVGGGVEGNVGAGALAHIVSNNAGVVGVTNPMPARGGLAPESIEQVRQNAPYAFRTQQRAVTARDYAEVAERHAGVQRAAATIRWTGSWRTVFLTVDRLGGADVDAAFKQEMRAHLERYRMAGHDVEIDAPRYVSLEIEMTVCIKPGYLKGDVRRALLESFSRHTRADGLRGVFHPDNYTFGQTVFLSPLYAAAQAVDGVHSVEITRFARQGETGDAALDAGKLELNRLEIARLDNDPNFPERGVFRLNLEGGR